MHFAFAAMRIVHAVILDRVWHDKGRLDGQTSRAIDQIVPVQEPQGIVEALFAHVREYLRLWREQDAEQPVHVVFGELDACVRNVYLEKDIWMCIIQLV